MTSEMIGTISRFFFLTLLDEQAAFSASARALQMWRSRLSRSRHPEVESEPLLVGTLSKQWSSLGKEAQAGQPVVFATEDWQIPAGVDLGPWLEFRRESPPDEFLAVLMVKILKFSVPGVAAGLKISEGTVTHRLSRGLRKLGAIQAAPGAKRV
jgi:DNA-directed RNA polymerase specialized sigma24 family protein